MYDIYCSENFPIPMMELFLDKIAVLNSQVAVLLHTFFSIRIQFKRITWIRSLKFREQTNNHAGSHSSQIIFF